MIITVIGGTGSGKSEYAENTAMQLSTGEVIYLATMKSEGEESLNRIARHQKQRRGKGFITKDCEEGFRATLENLEQENINKTIGPTVLLECLSNLVANEMFHENLKIPYGDGVSNRKVKNFWVQYEEELYHKLKEEFRRLISLSENLIIVTNNVFDDGVQYEEGTRSYIRLVGRMNTYLSQLSSQVIEVVFSRPVRWK